MNAILVLLGRKHVILGGDCHISNIIVEKRTASPGHWVLLRLAQPNAYVFFRGKDPDLNSKPVGDPVIEVKVHGLCDRLTGAFMVTEVVGGQQPEYLTAHPTEGFLYVSNFGQDNILRFSINPTTGQLTAAGTFADPAINTGAVDGPIALGVVGW